MADALHSKFSASSSHLWLACAGGLTLSKGKRDRSSAYADEGTAAHELASWCLADWSADRQVTGVWPKPAVAYLGRVIVAGQRTYTIDEDMARDVQLYIDNIAEYAVGADAVRVEAKVNYARTLFDWSDDDIALFESNPAGDTTAQAIRRAQLQKEYDDAWGTSDIVILKGTEVQVHDLKYGQGELVVAEDNPQCQLYALGALAEFDGIAVDYTRARMVIHQVRKDPRPQEWDCTVVELRKFGARAAGRVDVVNMAEAPLGDMTQAEWEREFLNPGDKQCRWCKAKATCPALRAEVASTIAGAPAAIPADFENLDAVLPTSETDNDVLSAAMSKVDLIEDWCKAVRAEMEARLLAGTEFEDWKLVQGKRGNRAWSDERAAEELLKSFRLKAEQMYSMKVISPTQAEKLAPAAKPKKKAPGAVPTTPVKTPIGVKQWPKLQALIVQSEGGLHVAPKSDKRDAIKVTPTADEFPDLEAADREQQAPAPDDNSDLA